VFLGISVKQILYQLNLLEICDYANLYTSVIVKERLFKYGKTKEKI